MLRYTRRFWIVFGLMAISAIGIGTLTGLQPPGHRSNGYCTTIVLTIASCAYFAMVRTHIVSKIIHHLVNVVCPG